MNNQAQLSDVVAGLAIKFRARRVDPSAERRKRWPADASHWTVTIAFEGRRMATAYSMGSAHRSEPTLVDVLGCLASDASGVDGQNFEGWAAEYGYDIDSRAALRSYRACVRSAASLRRVFGAEIVGRFIGAEW